MRIPLIAIFSAFKSFVYLVGRRIVGKNISFDFITLVSPNATLKTRNNGKISIGRKSAVLDNSEISVTTGVIRISDNVFINRNCMIVSHDSIKIGKGTTIGPNVCIYDHDHDGKGGFICKPIVIGEYVWIGAGCIILKGVTIGDHVVIGAGSLVTKDIESKKKFYQKRNTIII